MFSCNLPSALLAEWPGSFTCYCGNMGGGTNTKIRVSTESWPWRRKFSCHSSRDLNLQPFNHESGALTTGGIWRSVEAVWIKIFLIICKIWEWLVDDHLFCWLFHWGRVQVMTKKGKRAYIIPKNTNTIYSFFCYRFWLYLLDVNLFEWFWLHLTPKWHLKCPSTSRLLTSCSESTLPDLNMMLFCYWISTHCVKTVKTGWSRWKH